MSVSISDRFIEVMGELRRLEISNDEPMRHEIRKCRATAFQELGDAIDQAWVFVELAKSMRDSAQRAVNESTGNTDTGSAS